MVWPNSDHALMGTLVYDPATGLELTVFENSNDPIDFFAQGRTEFPVIHGQLHDGRTIALLDCFSAGQTGWLSGFIERRIVANTLLIASGLEDPSQLAFSEVRLELTLFNEWVAISPLRRSLGQLSPGEGGKWLTIECERTPSIGFSPWPRSLSFVISHELSSGGKDLLSHAEVTSKYILRIGTPKGANLEDAQHIIGMVQALFSILCGHQVYIQSAVLIREGIPVEERLEREIRLHKHWARPRSAIRPKHVNELLLNLPMLKDAWPVIWSHWCREYERYKTSARLLMSPDLYEGGTLTFRFLAMMQALETFDRNMHPGAYVDADEYDVIYRELSTVLQHIKNTSLRDSLKSRLKYGNEFSLRKRLFRLCDGLEPSVRTLLFGDRHRQCIELIVDTRNYLTHYDEELGMRALRGEGLHYASQLCRWLCTACLLRAIGVPANLLAEQLRRHRRITDARDRLLAHLRHQSV